MTQLWKLTTKSGSGLHRSRSRWQRRAASWRWPAEVIILRPAPQDTHMISTDNLKGPLLIHDHSFDLAAPPLNVSRGPAPD
jgi:hypothetical protein